MQTHRIEEIRIGVMVLAALATLVVLTLIFGKQSIINFGEYTLQVRFQETPGVKINTPVIKNGVQIGRVSKIELVDEDRSVEVSILLPTDRKIYSNEECRVRKTMLMGDSTLEFVKRKKYVGEITVIPPSTPLVGAPTLDLVSGFSSMEGDIQKAVHGVSETAEKMSTFMDRANTFIGSPEEMKVRQQELQETMRVMTQTMRNMNKFAEGAGNLLNDPAFQADSKRIAHELPDMLQHSRKLLTDSGDLIKEFRAAIARGMTTMDRVDEGLGKIDKGLGMMDTAVQKFGDGMDKFAGGIDGVTKFTDRLGDDGTELMQSLRRSGKKLESIFDDVSTIISAINNADGTFKRVMRSPELYENLMKTLGNIEKITDEVNTVLRTDVKPITNNVRIITDKAARDPSIFIRNLLKKQPPVKGGLPMWGDGLGSDVFSVETFDIKQFKEAEIILDDPSEFEPTLYTQPYTTPKPTFCQRVASLFSSGKSTCSAGKCSTETISEGTEPMMPPLTLPNFESPQNSEEIPLALNAPKQEPAALPLPNGTGTNTVIGKADEIPAEGRIVCVDPRYAAVGKATTVQQMSHQVDETDPPPKLVFTR